MEDKLRGWGISEEIIRNFVDNCIEESQLVDLDQNVLKELVPTIGPRLVVSKEIEKLKKELSEQQSLPSTLTISSCNSTTSSLNETLLEEINSNNTAAINDTIVMENFGMGWFSIAAKCPDFDLLTLLKTSPMGNSIIKYYATHKKLDHTRRNRLVDIIIKHIFNYIISSRLTPEEYNFIAAKIVTMFPTETLGIYYVPAIKKSESHTGKSVVAKGKLVDKCRNILYKSGERLCRKRTSRETDFGMDENEIPTKMSKNYDGVEDDIMWLKHNHEPWAMVLDKWGKTFEIRRMSKTSTSAEFFKEWPILQDLRSTVLINLDFEKLFKNFHLNFHSNWDNFFQTVYLYKKDIIHGESIASHMITELEQLTDEDQKVAVQMKLLAYLIPPKGRTKIGKNVHWKFSTTESVCGIMVHVKAPGDIDKVINDQTDFAYNRKISVQPYVIIEGDTLCKVRTAYLVVDTIKYQFLTLWEAFDTLFKVYHVLHLKYPPQSEHLYTIIQRGVYKIETSYDNITPQGHEILSLL